jgi:ABC-type enterochelin transport system ATPase subunit
MYAERIVIMQHGKVLLDGPANQVIHSTHLKLAFDDAITIHILDNGRPVIVANKSSVST